MQLLKNVSISGINPKLNNGVQSFYSIDGIFAHILLRVFASVHLCDIGLFLFLCYLGVGISVMLIL